MRILDPQSAILTNIEVLAYLSSNPPRRPPNPPPNSRNWVPSPDLRDHNTVVKEIHNYITRLSPHLQTYPKYTDGEPKLHAEDAITGQPLGPPAPVQLNKQMPVDEALRELIRRLQPYGLTKGEVLMIVNLGVGVQGSSASGEEGEGEGEGMEVDGEQGEEGEEMPEEDYGALALLDTVIEEREERLSNEDVAGILGIIRETLGAAAAGGGL